MKIKLLLNLQLLTLALVLFSPPAYSQDSNPECPAVQKVPDINCDGDVSVVVLGDSLVYGTGDTQNGGQGGYVTRAANRLSGVTFYNFGEPGLRTQTLLKQVRTALKPGDSSNLGVALKGADIVVLDLGRNDRWLFGLPIATNRTLKRIANLIRTEVQSESGYTPYVVTAVLMLPNRGSQGPWVRELNGYIIKGHSKTAPANLRFDNVSKRLLSEDQVHPTSKGYDALASVFVKYLTRRVKLPAQGPV